MKIVIRPPSKQLIEGDTRVVSFFAWRPAYLYRVNSIGEGVVQRPQEARLFQIVVVKQQVMRVMDNGCYWLAWHNVEYMDD